MLFVGDFFCNKSKVFRFNNMKVVNPNNTNHTIKLITRFEATNALELNLYNECNGQTSVVGAIYVIDSGYTSVDFNYDFIEGDTFQIKITQIGEVVYRGKLIATSQDTQEYLNDNNEYYYE